MLNVRLQRTVSYSGEETDTLLLAHGRIHQHKTSKFLQEEKLAGS